MEKVHTYALTAPEMIQMNYENPTMTVQSLRVPRPSATAGSTATIFWTPQ